MSTHDGKCKHYVGNMNKSRHIDQWNGRVDRVVRHANAWATWHLGHTAKSNLSVSYNKQYMTNYLFYDLLILKCIIKTCKDCIITASHSPAPMSQILVAVAMFIL